MQKSAVVLAGLLLVSPLFAQSAATESGTVISDLTLTGVTHLSSAQMQPMLDEIKSHRYSPDQPQKIKERIRDAFLQKGYLEVEVGSPDISARKESNGRETLAVTVSVLEGQQFRLKTISFNGATAFPNDQLRHLFAIANGDIFNTEKIRDGLDDLRKLFSSHGYINFTPVPNTDADDETLTVSLKIDLDEGKQFHFGQLVLDGDEPQAGTAAPLAAAWKPYEGKLFKPELLDQFWDEIKSLMPVGTKQESALGFKELPESALILPKVTMPIAK